MVWAGLIQLVEGLKSRNPNFLVKKELCLKTATQKCCLSFQPARPTDVSLKTTASTLTRVFDTLAAFQPLGLPASS